MTEKALAEEVAFYEEHFAEYRRKYAGRYLLIHGAELIGVYEDELEANYDGYRQVWRNAGRRVAATWSLEQANRPFPLWRCPS